MTPSTHCYSIIKNSEGYSSKAYVCPAGKYTIGFGSTRWQNGDPIKPSDITTQAEAEKLLQFYVDKYAKQIESALNADEIVINQSQFDALVSFAYNVGITALLTSTLWKKLKVHDFKSAADEFLRWTKSTVHGQKVELPGLVKRRQAERCLFLS